MNGVSAMIPSRGSNIRTATLLSANHAEDPRRHERHSGNECGRELGVNRLLRLLRALGDLTGEPAKREIARQHDRAAGNERVESAIRPDERILVVLLRV